MILARPGHAPAGRRLARHARPHYGRQVLWVVHAGVIRAVLSIVLDIPVTRLFRIKVHNAGLTRNRVDGQDAAAWPALVFHAVACEPCGARICRDIQH